LRFNIVKSVHFRIIILRLGDMSLLKLVQDKLIKVVEHPGINFDGPALVFPCALDMSILAALDAPVESHLGIGWPTPFFEASGVPVANMVALAAPDHIRLLTVLGLMADLVALETHLLSAVEGLMRVLPAKDAVQPLSLIWTLPSHMPELLAIVALYSDVLCRPVPLALHLLKILKRRFFAVFGLGFRLAKLTILLGLLFPLVRDLGLLGRVHEVFVSANEV
jgi:hypothetical protein